MPLPPPKAQMDPADADAFLNFANGFVSECINAFRGDLDQARRNYNLYLGNHWLTVAPDESARYVFNRIKSIIMAHAAIQTGQRPEITFTERQSGEQGLCYIDTRELAKLQITPDIGAILSRIPPECLHDDPANPLSNPQPLPKEVYAIIEQAIEQGKMLTEQAAMADVPAPPVIPPELICEVNDNTATEALQLLFDAKWEECNADYFVLTDSFFCGIVGWQHMYYRWDKAAQNHTLYNCEFPQVFVDPTRMDISQAAVAIWDYYMSAEQAIAEYPEFQQVVRDNWQAGMPMPAGTFNYTPANIYQQANYFREMGAIRFMWLRNQPYPMDPAEALRQGLIVQGLEEVSNVAATGAAGAGDNADAGGAQETPESGGQGAVDSGGTGQPQQPADAGERPDMGTQSDGGESPGAGAGTQGGSVDEDAVSGAVGGVGAVAGAAAGLAQSHRPAFLLVVNGQPAHAVKPWDADWPMRRGIREIVIIANTLVADRECADPEIPLTHNVNFPKRGPTGQGTPEDLEMMNGALNQILSDLIHQVTTGSFPSYIIPESVQKQRQEIGQTAYIKPGTVLTAPDMLFEQFKGELIKTLEPGQVSADLWKFLQQLLDLIDKQGDMASVLQGATNPGMSGKLFADASAAAQTSIMFRSKRVEMMLKHLAKLMVGGIMQMSPEDCAAVIRKYPVYVWYAIHKWWKSGHFAYDIAAEITSGGGATKQTKANQLVAASAQGVQVSQPRLLKALEVDSDANLKEIVEWDRKMAQAMPQQPTQQPGASSQSPPPKPAGQSQ